MAHDIYPTIKSEGQASRLAQAGSGHKPLWDYLYETSLHRQASLNKLRYTSSPHRIIPKHAARLTQYPFPASMGHLADYDAPTGTSVWCANSKRLYPLLPNQPSHLHCQIDKNPNVYARRAEYSLNSKPGTWLIAMACISMLLAMSDRSFRGG